MYAGFLSHADAQIGRLLDYLQDSGQLENTIIVLVSDNGASGEGGPNGSVNENKIFNGIPETMEENLKYVDELGGPNTYNHYPTGWAWAFNTPFKMWKRYSSYEGGTADPLIVAWPKTVPADSATRRQYAQAIDIVLTLYECLGVELPDTVKGHLQKPLEAVSFAASLTDAAAETAKQTQFYSMLGTRAIWHRGWKAAAVSPAAPNAWADFSQRRWELFDTEADPTETDDLADRHPEKLRELIDLWWTEVGRYQALPLESRDASQSSPRRGRNSPSRGTATSMVLSASFDKDEGTMPTGPEGTLTLHVNDKTVGTGRIRPSRESSRSPARASTSVATAASR